MEQIERVGAGVYQVDVDGRRELVYVAGPPSNMWVFWNGHTYRGDFTEKSARPRRERRSGLQSLTAPMPATVIRVLVSPSQHVRKGDTIFVLEAMKMELPIRALSDAVVKSVRCREGELVQADAILLEFEDVARI